VSTVPDAIPALAPIRSLDELSPGQVFDLGTLVLPLAEVVEFARRFDAQPFHLDPRAAEESIFGELIVSGLHTLSAVFGRITRSGLIREVSQGGTGIDTKWPAPLRPDEPVRLRVEVLETRVSRSRANLGLAKLRYVAARERDGVVVLEAVGTHLMRR
jgi:acyl dehydratase